MGINAKKAALISFASILAYGSTSSADWTVEPKIEFNPTPETEQAFERLWEKGAIKLDPNTGTLIFDEDFLKKLTDKELGDLIKMAGGSPESSGLSI